MKDKISIAIIGLGKRGSGLLRDILVKRKDLDIVAVCDVYEDRTAQAAKTITDDGRPKPKRYTDYKLLLEEVKTDSVLISCSWEWHIEIAIAAMKAGIAVALEVGGCFSMEELWSLVHTQEETGTPFMFMENCCFGRSELLATGAYRAGALGTVVACEGSYTHDLREEIAGGNINRHYRLRNYIHRNCDNYPTHDAGPIAKLLNINRGNKFVSLVSVASKACGLREYVAERPDKYPDLQDVEFNQGDIVTTIITCANGETVTLRLNTTLPTFYSRDFVVRGTKGMYNMNANMLYFDGDAEGWEPSEMYPKFHNSANDHPEFLPKIWKSVTKEQLEAGHGGMDYFEFECFVNCLKRGEEFPIDVYDAATYMAISVLSEQSVASGGSVQFFPDFTCGKWQVRKPLDVTEF